MLVKQIRRRVTDKGSDVRLESSQLVRPEPTDPSRWTWQLLHSWKREHAGHITELEMRSALTAIRWRCTVGITSSHTFRVIH